MTDIKSMSGAAAFRSAHLLSVDGQLTAEGQKRTEKPEGKPMSFVSIPPTIDAALLAHANLSAQDISKLQASGAKLNAEKLDAVMVDRGLQTHERIAVKNMLRRNGVL